MTRLTPLLFLTLALGVMLGCCHGAPCLSDGSTDTTPETKKTTAPASHE